ncbi:hypothetical protein EYF80_047838 [Liparis tanakae]|uniref:Uncharacterized protein n=1 Tax=Liparis tanakae TaxID=230148 RepID=A0A4Z2FMH6_9TELE|nr:hypothetical protein EYF80_047838 [Liparis tanakae]
MTGADLLKVFSVLQSDEGYKKGTGGERPGRSGGDDQSVFIIAGHLVIVLGRPLPAGGRRGRGGSRRCRVASSLGR